MQSLEIVDGTPGFRSLLAYPEEVFKVPGIYLGMDILVTGYIGLAGTVWLAKNREGVLRRTLSQDYVDSGKALLDGISRVPQAADVGSHGIAALHYVAEGGFFAGLWKFAQALGVGVYTKLREIPVKQQTIEFCEVFDLNPYRLLSGGCTLMAAEHGFETMAYMEGQGISCRLIGEITGDNGRVVAHDDTCMYLTKPERDEIYKVL